MLSSLRIGQRLAIGFGALCLIIGVSTLVTVYNVSRIDHMADNMASFRMPAADAGGKMLIEVNASLAALRGYLLTGNAQFKTDRAANWTAFDEAATEFDKHAKKFQQQTDIEKWAESKKAIVALKAAQEKAENIAHTPDAQPALQILSKDAAPRANAMFLAISKMIDEEGNLEATVARKALLKDMADFRGSLGLSVANIRAFLLTAN